jgi:hypothetical protein
VWLEGLGKLRNPMASPGIEPVGFHLILGFPAHILTVAGYEKVRWAHSKCASHFFLRRVPFRGSWTYADFGITTLNPPVKIFFHTLFWMKLTLDIVLGCVVTLRPFIPYSILCNTSYFLPVNTIKIVCRI